MNFGALILAAGRSSRMDVFKPLMEVNGKSLVENAINLFNDSEIQEIITVIGYRSEDLIPIVERTASRYAVNENYRDGMFASIQKGVAELKDRCDAFFLLPVDIPCVRTTTVRKLMEKYYENPSILVCYPQFDSRRGHPPLIAGSLIKRILSYNGKGGMRGLLMKCEDQAITVPVTDPFVRLDVDTRRDFVRLENQIKDSCSK